MTYHIHAYKNHLKVVDNKKVNGPITEQQEAFAKAYVATGGSVEEACKIAEISHTSYGRYLLTHNPKVIKAIHDETLAMFARNAPVAQATLVKLMHGADSESIRFQAACKLLDYAGMQPAQRQEITLKDDRSDAEILSSINNILEALGVHKPITIDGDIEDA